MLNAVVCFNQYFNQLAVIVKEKSYVDGVLSSGGSAKLRDLHSHNIT